MFDHFHLFKARDGTIIMITMIIIIIIFYDPIYVCDPIQIILYFSSIIFKKNDNEKF